MIGTYILLIFIKRMQKFSQNPTFRRRIVTEDIVPQAHIPTYGSTPDTTSTRSKGEDYRYAKALYGITKISHKGGFLSIPDIKSHKSLIKKGEYTLDKAKSILSNISDKIPNKESFKSLIKHVLKVVKSKLPKNEGEGGIIPGLLQPQCYVNLFQECLVPGKVDSWGCLNLSYRCSVLGKVVFLEICLILWDS